MTEAPGEAAAAGWRAPGAGWRLAWRVAAVAFGAVVVVAVGRALAGQDWAVVGTLLRRRDGGQVALLLGGALLAATVGPVLGLLSWRAVLLASGPPVSLPGVLRVFFVGYLAKYVPGKIPGMVATVKVALANGVTLPRMLGTGAFTMALVHLTGLTVGLLAGVRLLGDRAAWIALAAVPVIVIVWRPDVVSLGGRLALRLLRRPAPQAWPSARRLRVAVAAQCLSWLVSGLHLWLLAVAMGAPPARSLLLCVGGFSLATVVGLLSFVTPDGLGVREAVLLGALTTVLPLPAATVVALASRLVTTVSEVVLGGAGLAAAELIHRRMSTIERLSTREAANHA